MLDVRDVKDLREGGSKRGTEEKYPNVGNKAK